MGYEEPTPIQMQATPLMLHVGVGDVGVGVCARERGRKELRIMLVDTDSNVGNGGCL